MTVRVEASFRALTRRMPRADSMGYLDLFKVKVAADARIESFYFVQSPYHHFQARFPLPLLLDLLPLVGRKLGVDDGKRDGTMDTVGIELGADDG